MPTDQIMAKEASELSLEDLKNVKRMLDERSSAHCLAKWYQVTLNLHNGRSASCCLQPSKPLNLKAIHQDIAEIHNGEAHVLERVALRQGQKIDECSACWNVEKEGRYSERHFKSADSWAIGKMAESQEDPRNISPTYVEVSFSSQCQLRCSYCNPETSSSIAKEIEQSGAYPDRFTQMGIIDRSKRGVLPVSEQSEATNPYVDAFWHWIPTVYKDLKVLRVTGGEPFLSEDTFKFIDYVKNNPNPLMAIEFNSNLSFPSAVFQRFENAFSQIPRDNYKSTTLYVSLDCWGERAEYIRFGMRIKEIEKNIERLLSKFPQMRLTITSTISVLGIQTFDELLSKVIELKKKWGHSRISLTAYPLVFPPFQAVSIASDPLKAELQRVEAKAIESEDFSVREKEMISAISSSSRQVIEEDLERKLKIDFYRFFETYDRRKKTSLIKIFPEHINLFEKGKELSSIEKKIWLKDVHSTNSQEAVEAIESLVSSFLNDEDISFELLSRLVTKDDLSLKYLLNLESFSEESIQLIVKGLSLPDRATDLVKLLFQNPKLKNNFEDHFNRIDINSSNFNSEQFYIWNKSVIDFNIDVELWSPVLTSLYKKCHSLKLKNSLILSTKYLQKRYTDSIGELDSTINTAFFQRRPLNDVLLLENLFTNENRELTDFLPSYLASIPLDINLAKSLITIAKQKKDYAGQIANGLAVWRGKLNQCLQLLFEGDAYINALIAKNIGLDLQISQTLLNLDEIKTADTLGEWLEAGLNVEPSLLSSIIFDRSISGHIPFKWIALALKMSQEKDLATSFINDFIDSFEQINSKQTGYFFDALKAFSVLPSNSTLISFFKLADKSTFYNYIEYSKRLHVIDILIEEYLSRIELEDEKGELPYFYNMLTKESVTIDLDLHLRKIFITPKEHWGLWELIVINFEPNRVLELILKFFKEDPKIFQSVERSYFKYFFNEYGTKIEFTKFESQILPSWWTLYLDEAGVLTNKLVWSALLSVNSDLEYWSMRDYISKASSFDFDLKSINHISLSDEAKYDLACLLFDKNAIDESVITSYQSIISSLSHKYIWSLLDIILQKNISAINFGYFIQAAVFSNLSNESYYSTLLQLVEKMDDKVKYKSNYCSSWIRYDSTLQLMIYFCNAPMFLDALNDLNPVKRIWYLKQYLSSPKFLKDQWGIHLLKELDEIDPQLLFIFNEEVNLSKECFFDDLLSLLPLSSILSARLLPTDDFVLKLNCLKKEEGFFCLQLRNDGPFDKDWSIEQVKEMLSEYQDEFFKIAKDKFSKDFWIQIAQTSVEPTEIAALLLPINEFLPRIDNGNEYHFYLIELHAKNLSKTSINNDLLTFFRYVEKDKIFCFLKNIQHDEELFNLYAFSNNDVSDIFEQVFQEKSELPHHLLRDILLRFIHFYEAERIIARIKEFNFCDIHLFSFDTNTELDLVTKKLVLRTCKILVELGAESYALDLALKSSVQVDEKLDVMLAPLYFLCENNVLKNLDWGPKFISTLAIMPEYSQFCWNLVDIIIDHKLDRSLGYRHFASSSLVSRVKNERPFFKLLAYFKGIVHTSADM